MKEFKSGDRVRVIGMRYGGWDIGSIGTVQNNTYTFGGIVCPYVRKDGESFDCYHNPGDLELIDDNNIENMNLSEKVALAFKKEPNKSFFKAGITDKDDKLTTDGTTLFTKWLLEKHGEEFKKEFVDPILALEEDK